MHRDKRVTRLFAALFLMIPLLLGACADDNDDATEQSSTNNVAAAQVTSTSEDDEDATATEDDETPESTVTEEAGEDENQDDGATSDFATVVQDVVDEVRPAVPFITVTMTQQGPFGGQNQQQGVGSGVIFDEEGHILTNNHVVQGSDQITVVLPDGRQFEAEVIGRAPQQDLAVLDIDGDNLPVADLAESPNLQVGQWAVAIGNALGLQGGASVSVGVISALDRTLRPSQNEPPIEGLIQTDAAINPGNSGGPLVNLDGEVIGINTAKIPQAEGIGFAIPISTAQTIVNQILTGEPRATLGVSVANVTPEIAARYALPTDSGVFVAEVEQGGPAASAGIQRGDIIVGLGGEEIQDLQDLRSALSEYEPGETVTVTVNRGGTEQQIEVELGESIIIQPDGENGTNDSDATPTPEDEDATPTAEDDDATPTPEDEDDSDATATPEDDEDDSESTPEE